MKKLLSCNILASIIFHTGDKEQYKAKVLKIVFLFLGVLLKSSAMGNQMLKIISKTALKTYLTGAGCLRCVASIRTYTFLLGWRVTAFCVLVNVLVRMSKLSKPPSIKSQRKPQFNMAPSSLRPSPWTPQPTFKEMLWLSGLLFILALNR